MISLDQVYLLEEKVESAVAKIQQLQAENDALRRQCSELKNALSSKTEQLNSFSVDQNQIEQGIKKALDRLNSIENSILKGADQVSHFATEKPVEIKQNAAIVETIVPTQPIPKTNSIETPVKAQTEEELAIKETFQIQNEKITKQENDFTTQEMPNFSNMNEIKSKTEMDLSQQFTDDSDFSEAEFNNEEENPDGLGFDIF